MKGRRYTFNKIQMYSVKFIGNGTVVFGPTTDAQTFAIGYFCSCFAYLIFSPSEKKTSRLIICESSRIIETPDIRHATVVAVVWKCINT